MSAEMASEAMEVITMAVDKHQQTKNYEVSTLGVVFGAASHFYRILCSLFCNGFSIC